MNATRVAELRRLVADAELRAEVDDFIAAAREVVAAWDNCWELRDFYDVGIAIEHLKLFVGRR